MDASLNKSFEKLKYDLVRENLISYEDLENAQAIAQAQNINLGQALINCNLIDENKLLKFIEEDGTYSLITTFSDNMFSDGDLYKNNGFSIYKEIPCDFYYLINNRRVNKQNISKEWFLHHGYEYIEDMSETELAKYNDIKRIYDAGKIKWYKRLH